MLVPHLVFFGAYVATKLLMPSLLPWLAKDTYFTAILSLWYPLIWTIGWISGQREPGTTETAAASTKNGSEASVSSELSIIEQVEHFEAEKKAQIEYERKKKTDGTIPRASFATPGMFL